MEPTHSCGFCHTNFAATDVRQLYCRAKCSHAARYVRLKQRKLAGLVRLCLMCSADISARSGNARYCRACRKKRAAAKVIQKQPLHDACKGCAKVFDKPQRHLFCSRQCIGRFGRAQQVGRFPGICVACGRGFIAIDARPNTCSKTCSAWARRLPGVQRVLVCECEYCLQPFNAHIGGQRFCSPSCAKLPSDARRRMARRGGYVEDVSKARLAVRDKWTCQLCGKRVDKSLVYPHPMSWSLDHVIPIALGGEHSYANTQLAHLSCNVSKGARLLTPVQLALIG